MKKRTKKIIRIICFTLGGVAFINAGYISRFSVEIWVTHLFATLLWSVAAILSLSANEERED